MADKLVTYSALQFNKGMTPKVFSPDSATRIEHFDTITEVLRPFRALIDSANNQAVATTAMALTDFAILNSALYAVGTDHATPTTGAVYKWNPTAQEWQDKQSLGGTKVTSPMLHAHANYLFGLFNGTHLFRFDGVSTFDTTTFSVAHTTFCDAITHSKDGKMYIGLDNKIYSVDSTGASGAVALTLPNSFFRITSICEQGNYINIVGTDTKTLESSSLLWDRDTSVVDLTESYPLGRDVARHNATLLGTTFFVQVRLDEGNTEWSDKPMLIIKYLNGGVPQTLYEFPVTAMDNGVTFRGGKYVDNERLYFTSLVQFVGESAARNVVFCLDYKGRLTIAQNASIDTGTVNMTGVIRNGEGFWLGAGSDGAWNTDSAYTTVASYETNDIRSDDLSKNIDLSKLVVTCEPLPASSTVSAGSFIVGLPYTILTVGTTDFTLIGASSNTVGVKFVATGVGTGNGTATSAPAIVVKARKNEETDFTILDIFTGTNRAKFSLDVSKAKSALSGLDNARQVRIRLESTVGATITGLQAIFNPVTEQTA